MKGQHYTNKIHEGFYEVIRVEGDSDMGWLTMQRDGSYSATRSGVVVGSLKPQTSHEYQEQLDKIFGAFK